MKKKNQISVEKIIEKISKEEKYQSQQWKNLKWKEFLKDTQYRKVLNLIDGSEKRVDKLKEKLKNMQKGSNFYFS